MLLMLFSGCPAELLSKSPNPPFVISYELYARPVPYKTHLDLNISHFAICCKIRRWLEVG